VDFYQKYPGATRQIRTLDFHSLPFRTIPQVSGRHSLERGVDVKGHRQTYFFNRPFYNPDRLYTPPAASSCIYLPPHRRQ
jgi:hypothetical protein